MKRIAHARDFIRAIHHSLDDGVPTEPDGLGLMISRPGEGTLFLDASEGSRYSDTVSRLFQEFVKQEDMSRRSVERHLQNGMFTALDLRGRSARPFEERLDSAVQTLHHALTQAPGRYTCYVPVGGLASEGLPRFFGRERLIVLNRRQVRKMAVMQTNHEPSAGVHDSKEMFESLRRTPSWNSPALMVQVEARDFEAAQQFALRKTRQTLDILNFFADLVPYNYGWAYLPGQASRVTNGTVSVNAKGAIQTRLSVDGPSDLYSMKKLSHTRWLRPVLRRTQALMRQKPRAGLADAFLTAIEWAGRASVETKREQAFLLFAIALETIVLPESRTDELTYRLSTRVPHVLAKDRQERSDINVWIKKLYGIRSKIVHSGSYDVKEEDLGKLRAIAKGTIIRILLHQRIRRFRKTDELANWFNQKVLD